jgi:GAF domain-containing protein
MTDGHLAGVSEQEVTAHPAGLRGEQAVHALSRIAGGTFSSVRDVAQAIFDLVHELCGMRVCVLSRIDLATNTLTVLQASDRAGLGVTSGATLPADQMPCEFVVRNAKALRVFNLDGHPVFRTLPAHTRLGLCSYVGVPLVRSDGTVWGTLAAVDTEMRETTDAHIETLVVLARLAMFEFEREEQRQALAAHAQALAERLTMAKQLEEQQLKAVRLQTLLETAAAVSHEINNPLTVLQLRLERMRKRCTPGDDAQRDDVLVAAEAAAEIALVVERLRRVVRPVSTSYVRDTARMIDLSASVDERDEMDAGGEQGAA